MSKDLTKEYHIEQNAAELARNWYEVLKGNRLKALKLAIEGLDVPETDFGNISRTPQLGVLDFRAFLNFRGDDDNEVLKLKILNAISAGNGAQP